MWFECLRFWKGCKLKSVSGILRQWVLRDFILKPGLYMLHGEFLLFHNYKIEKLWISFSVVVWHVEMKNERACWAQSPCGSYWSMLQCDAVPVRPNALAFLPAVDFFVSRKSLYIFLAHAFGPFGEEWNKKVDSDLCIYHRSRLIEISIMTCCGQYSV